MKKSLVGVRVLLHRSRLKLGEKIDGVLGVTSCRPKRLRRSKGCPSYEKEKNHAVLYL